MDEYSQLVDKIQTLLYSSGKLVRDDIAPLAEQYHEACTHINGRLREVSGLLQQGLRGEALHQCDLEPKLQGAVTTLDFVELPQWLNLTSRFQLSSPPSLLIDTSAEIEDAYEAAKPVESLLRTHRLLAIARAPIGPRISVLRQIAAADARNSIWKEDLAEYEAVRFVELQNDFNRLSKANDLRACNEIKKEIDSTPWVRKVPKALRDAVNRSVGSMMTNLSQQKLLALATQMEQAMENLDVDLAEQLISQWHPLAQHAKPAPNSPAATTANRVIAWCESERAAAIEREEQAYVQAQVTQQLADFKAAVKGTATEELLVQRREELHAAGVAVPSYLEGQYEARLNEIRKARLKKRVGIGSAVGLIVAVVIGAVLYFVLR